MSRARKLATIWHGARAMTLDGSSLAAGALRTLSGEAVAQRGRVAEALLARPGPGRWRSDLPAGRRNDHPASPAAGEAPVGEGSR